MNIADISILILLAVLACPVCLGILILQVWGVLSSLNAIIAQNKAMMGKCDEMLDQARKIEAWQRYDLQSRGLPIN